MNKEKETVSTTTEHNPELNISWPKIANPKVYSEEYEKNTITVLLQHAMSDARLAEITASRSSYWHTAEACRNVVIALDELLNQGIG
jgi:hypothetical protein